MNIKDAMYSTVHDYPGGAVSLAPRLNMSAAILNSKVNPNTETHHLRLDEALKIMAFTDDYRMIEAMAEQLGGVFVKLPSEDFCGQESLIDLVLSVSAKNGKLCHLVNEIIKGGKISRKEASMIKAVISKKISALQKMKIYVNRAIRI